MKRSIVYSVVAAVVACVAACGSSESDRSTPVAPVVVPDKNVVFFLGDGLGITTLTAARIYSVGEEGELAIDTLPESAFVHTYSRDGQITDSAAAMAAYMTGVKANNRVISMSPETRAVDAQGRAYARNEDTTCPVAGNGTAVETLLELMKGAGYGTGIVATTRVTHATPASTYAHVCHRDAHNTIAAALVPGGADFNARLGDGLDVVIGGGMRNFLPSDKGGRRNDGRDLVVELRKANYQVASTRAQFDRLPVDGSKIMALLTPGDMSYDLDRDPAKEPSLAEMTGKAIDSLAAHNKGFFLMVAGGRIDHALHANNARRALQDTVALDDAIQLALNKLEAIDPGLRNTLIVATANHDHSLLMNGYAARTGKTEPGKPGVLGVVNNYIDGQPVRDVQGNQYTILGFGAGAHRLDERGQITADMLESPNYLQEAVVAVSGTEAHGGSDVFLGAKGMGAENFRGTLTNTDVFGLIKTAIAMQ